MKNFRDAVKREMEKEGWTVSLLEGGSEIKIVQLHCKQGKKEKYIRATGNGHGHVYKWVKDGLKGFRKVKKAPVFVAKVNGANEIIFIRLESLLNPKRRKPKW
jgi:hypothetical protein